MASHGASKAMARVPEAAPKEFHHMELMHGQNGGVIAQHHTAAHEQLAEHHFGPSDGARLAQHIGEHLGLSMEHSDPVEEEEQE